jgi:hypothetical protein
MDDEFLLHLKQKFAWSLASQVRGGILAAHDDSEGLQREGAKFSSCLCSFVVKFPAQMPRETSTTKAARLKKSSPRWTGFIPTPVLNLLPLILC